MALDGDVPVACEALKHDESGTGEIKRMWVSPDRRGKGLGRVILQALEQEATNRGVRLLRLETNGALTAAIGLYRSAGYREVPRFGADPYAEHWFAKNLSDDASGQS